MALYPITAKIISGGNFRLPNQDKLKRQNDLSCNLFILVLSVTVMTYEITTLFKWTLSVADTDLQIGGGVVSKTFFSALRASVWSKNKGGGPPGPSPAATDFIPGTPVLSEYLLAH